MGLWSHSVKERVGRWEKGKINSSSWVSLMRCSERKMKEVVKGRSRRKRGEGRNRKARRLIAGRLKEGGNWGGMEVAERSCSKRKRNWGARGGESGEYQRWTESAYPDSSGGIFNERREFGPRHDKGNEQEGEGKRAIK